MAKYAKIGRLLAEDFDEAPSWFKERFLRMLNRFKEPMETFMDKGLTVNDNMQGGIYEQTITIGSSVAAALPLSFKFAYGTPRIVLCGGCVDITSTETAALAPTIAWTYSDGVISITNMSGLSTNKTYRLRFLVHVN